MSLARYGDYKDSGVEWLGGVPAHWPIKRLRFVAELNPSKSELAGMDRSTEVSFLPMEAIGDDGSINLERTRPVAEVETGYTYFRDGDVTLAKITPCFENGKGALMQGLACGIGFGTTELIVARPKPSEVLGSLLNWIFRSPNFRAQGEASMYGAGGQKRVPDDFVRDFSWSFPPLDEQLAIATFLDHETAKIDALMAEQEKLIALLAEKRQATISHAVTRGLNPDAPMKDSGVPWLGEVPGHWGVLRFKWLIERNDGGVWGDDPDGANDTVVLRSTEQTVDGRWQIDEPAKRRLTDKDRLSALLEVGDLLLTKSSGSALHIGKTTLVDEQVAELGACYSNFMQRIRVSKELAPKLAWYILNNGLARVQLDLLSNSTTGLANLNGTIIGDLVLAVAPAEEQTAIVTFLDAETTRLDTLRAESERAITLLKERRAALIAAAVTGQIDVRGWVQPKCEAEAA